MSEFGAGIKEALGLGKKKKEAARQTEAKSRVSREFRSTSRMTNMRGENVRTRANVQKWG